MQSNGDNVREDADATFASVPDGVPHELTRPPGNAVCLTFGPPSRYVSVPTRPTSTLGISGHPAARYESLYFDKIRSGAARRRAQVHRLATPTKSIVVHGELDYQEPLAFEFLVYVAPEKVWRTDMQRFRDRFRAAPQTRDYFAFLKGTDGLLHIRGPERLAVALESLDKILREIQTTCGRETEIVLFSDHGMNLRENQRIHLKTHLREGLLARQQLLQRSRTSLAILRWLCGYAAIYGGDEEGVLTLRFPG